MTQILLLLLMGAHARVAHRGGHGLAPAQGVPARGVPRVRPSWKSQLPAMTINSLQPGHGRSPSGSSPGWIDLLRDHSAYRIILRVPRHVTK